MVRALNTAASGMHAQQTQIDVIANNLANVNTAGFKRSRAEFQDLYYQQIRSASEAGSGSSTPIGLEVGQGVRVMASQKLFTQGDMQETANPLDVAIEGRGFFKVIPPDGPPGYTRAGQLRKDQTGQLTNIDGYPLDPPIMVPTDATEVMITPQGVVQYKLPNDTNFSQAGEIRLTTFANAAGLESLGRGLLGASASSGDAVDGNPGQPGFGRLQQGFVESSNVKVVEEMIGLISAQRAYEMNSKVVQATDQMLREASNIR